MPADCPGERVYDRLQIYNTIALAALAIHSVQERKKDAAIVRCLQRDSNGQHVL